MELLIDVEKFVRKKVALSDERRRLYSKKSAQKENI